MELYPKYRAILSAEWISPHEDQAFTKALSETIMDVITSFRGKLINTGVPTYLCIFPSVFDGILSSIELLKISRGKSGHAIRLGLHYGSVEQETDMLNDETIGVAVNIQSFGKTNSLVISQAVTDQIKSHPQFKARSIGKFEINGLPGWSELFTIQSFGIVQSGYSWINRIRTSLDQASTILKSLF